MSVPRSAGDVIDIGASGAARRRARREADRLAHKVIRELSDYLAGDGLAAWDAHRDANTFIGLVMHHALDLSDEEVA